MVGPEPKTNKRACVCVWWWGNFSSTWGLTLHASFLARCTDQTWTGSAVLGTDQGLFRAMSLSNRGTLGTLALGWACFEVRKNCARFCMA